MKCRAALRAQSQSDQIDVGLGNFKRTQRIVVPTLKSVDIYLDDELMGAFFALLVLHSLRTLEIRGETEEWWSRQPLLDPLERSGCRLEAFMLTHHGHGFN